MSDKAGTKLIAQNKKVRREYELLEFLEAGLALQGTEVKSLRGGKVSFKDGYIRIRNGEAFLVGVHIAPYEQAGSHDNHDPERERKLLLHGWEIDKLQAAIEQKGLTVVPVKLYFKRGKVKLETALARGKKMHDRREDLKRKAVDIDTAREMARHK